MNRKSQSGTGRRRQRRMVTARLSLESLEPRIALHFDGELFGDPPYLSLSFAPDQTMIGNRPNRLHAKMDAVAPRAEWQDAVLRAFQTWSEQTNGDIGLVSEQGQAFGAQGRSRRDARFGDIRVGAIPLNRDYFAVSIPRGFVAGTWEGDILFNSLLTWNSVEDIYRVALHEAGHIFGLGESDDPLSPMYYQGIPSVTAPSSTDLERLHQLSGRRGDDRNDEPNNTLVNAYELFPDDDYSGETPAIVFGDIRIGDTDVFEIEPLEDQQGTMTVTVRTDGISLLNPRLQVTDAIGQVLHSVQSTRPGGDTLSITFPIDCTANCPSLFVHVDSVPGATYRAGGYALVGVYDQLVTFDAATIARYTDGEYRFLERDDFTEIFLDDPTDELALLRRDFNSNDTLSNATPLDTTAGFVDGARYEVVASLSEAVDIDYYRIKSPAELPVQNGGATIVLEPVWPDPFEGSVELLDPLGNVVATTPIIRHEGRVVLHATSLATDADYHVRVQGTNGINPAGNYRLVVSYGETTSRFSTFATGTLTAAVPGRDHELTFDKSVLIIPAYRGSSDNPGDRAVQVELRNQLGQVLASWGGASNNYYSHPSLLLPRGQYHFRVTSDAPWGSSNEAIDYSLLAAIVIDPLAVPRKSNIETPVEVIAPLIPDDFVLPKGRSSGSSPFRSAGTAHPACFASATISPSPHGTESTIALRHSPSQWTPKPDIDPPESRSGWWQRTWRRWLG